MIHPSLVPSLRTWNSVLREAMLTTTLVHFIKFLYLSIGRPSSSWSLATVPCEKSNQLGRSHLVVLAHHWLNIPVQQSSLPLNFLSWILFKLQKKKTYESPCLKTENFMQSMPCIEWKDGQIASQLAQVDDHDKLMNHHAWRHLTASWRTTLFRSSRAVETARRT